MSEPGGADPLRDLGKRLEQARQAQQGKPAGGRRRDMGVLQGGFALALRIVVELGAALGVGVAIGWAIDRWLGTRPWGIVVFFFIGAAAGMLNVYRTVGRSEMMNGGEPSGRGTPSKRHDDRVDEDEDED